jgi:cytoskeletal protein RodZ
VVGLILITAVFVGVRTWQGWDDGNPVRTAFESASSYTGDTVDSAAVPEAAAEPAETDDRAAAAEAVAAAAEAEAAAAAEAEPVEFTVGLTATDRSWVKVSEAGGEALFTGFLVAGESQDYTTEVPLTLWVGNAGVIEVAVDGQDQGPSGGSGEVREITVGADGFDD